MPDLAIQAITRGAEFRIDPLVPKSEPAGDGAGEPGGAAFGNALASSLGKLNEIQASAQEQSQLLATGQAEDLTSVVLEVERASLAMQLASQIRNRAVDSYHEIFRMQI